MNRYLKVQNYFTHVYIQILKLIFSEWRKISKKIQLTENIVYDLIQDNFKYAFKQHLQHSQCLRCSEEFTAKLAS